MTSIRLQALNELLAAVRRMPSITDPANVQHRDVRGNTFASRPAALVSMDRDELATEDRTTGQNTKLITATVDLYADESTRQANDGIGDLELLDPLTVELEKELLKDRTLNGTAADMEPIGWGPSVPVDGTVVANFQIAIKIRHAFDDPEDPG